MFPRSGLNQGATPESDRFPSGARFARDLISSEERRPHFGSAVLRAQEHGLKSRAFSLFDWFVPRRLPTRRQRRYPNIEIPQQPIPQIVNPPVNRQLPATLPRLPNRRDAAGLPNLLCDVQFAQPTPAIGGIAYPIEFRNMN